MVRRLTLIGQRYRSVKLLRWMAMHAVKRGQPLFPNVKQLLVSQPPYLTGRHNFPQRLGFHPKGLRSIGTALVFGEVDAACVDEMGWPGLLPFLPARHWGTICFHDMYEPSNVSSELPESNVDSAIVFSGGFFYPKLALSDKWFDNLRSKCKLTSILYAEGEGIGRDVVDPANQDPRAGDFLCVEWFDRSAIDECPVCTICGKCRVPGRD